MLSTHLIVDFAFFVGLAFAFNPARKFIKRFLSSCAKETDERTDKALALSEKLNGLLGNMSPKRSEVDGHVNEILSLAEDRCRTIFKRGQQDLEKMIEENINLAAEKIEMRIENFVRSLRLSAVDVAAGAAHRMIREDIDGHGMDRDSTSSPGCDENIVKKLH